MTPKKVKAGGITFSNDSRLVYIAGPCVIESEKGFTAIASKLKTVFSRLKTPFALKASFDKANRTSHKSFRGIGMKKSLDIAAQIKRKLAIPVLIDVHETWQAPMVSKCADIIQIPAFLSRQTDLLAAAADTGKTVNIKKGQFMSPWEIQNAVKKIESRGNRSILLTERGTCFGYNNLVVDMRSIEIMKETGYPVIFDCTHSVQRPAGLGNITGGDVKFALPLAKAACILKIAGIFFETHPDPSKALSDGPNSLKLSLVCDAVNMLNHIDTLAKDSGKWLVASDK
ncbi:MAG: 3-deoxy-8-phosphooctulonate synthase [Elusimicrobia bacterium]|nr:3-deoxy-8-phosphooctulonate synthase [Elusimicrobiota bacterium]